ncbi:7-dehydrosterol-delta 7-reductase [Lobosporangium transversale]|uniref:7-dehydrocholesterol reductase n=1 Tax=Lobosporangium transversale TaxID=64571 RepID=A0A1Y2GIC6_9FUNG|nr:7-dehydrosterol-delta 7-reductase [Lobosporangium transversale]XP_021879849.1 7-dehydrosterol-delta 7-reductase [Lobosporangium transversale]ORZ10942.1 7-dehydrosterol-delta 7-reductase [Lobosporangium transversale]ORZ11752.1 7-dehydrosterol-delta 7-reductase [Lobosporangium transversale]|eukprot:XP_021879459.1 7-dehydrosterol-delta 7-reductase [Lobosporangium transversale]
MAVQRKPSPQETKVENKIDAQVGKTWGRDRDVSFGTILISLGILVMSPLWVYNAPDHMEALKTLLIREVPRFSPHATRIAFGWLLFQAALYAFLPAKIGYGQRTPAGHLSPTRKKRVNGLLAWIISHIIFAAGGLYFGWWRLSVIQENWGGLLLAANMYGYFLTFFCYFKARVFPSHPADRKFSGSFIYDLLMGIEFNPRIGKYFDFKLFHNGRPGIVAWTMIDLSFAAAQYQKIGYVTNSMILLILLHGTYVLDYFYNEDWYLRTIDIAHDHFGFYLAWGDAVWLPWLYTLQSHYLFRNPVDLTPVQFAIIFAIGFTGYFIFRSVNHQKDIVRSTNGECMIWGKPAKVIRTSFVNLRWKVHNLMMALAMCMTCVPSTSCLILHHLHEYLLLHRIQRDHTRCKGKYGKYWRVREALPYKLFPYIY